MYAIQFEIRDGKIVILNRPEGTELLEVPRGEYGELYSFLTHEKDFCGALEFFEQWGENAIINKALFVAALSQFMKCFQKCGGRKPLDESIFNRNSDAKKGFEALKALRNKYIIHDDSLYDQSRVGVLISRREESVIEWIHINFSANVFGREYMEPLFNVIFYAKGELEKMIEDEGNKMLEDYREKAWEEVEKMNFINYVVPNKLK